MRASYILFQANLALLVLVLLPAAAWSQVGHYPLLAHADLPLYPGIARALHLTGTVQIRITVAKGEVVGAKVESVTIESHNGGPLSDDGKKKIGLLLSTPSLANIKGWHFEHDADATFTIKFVYRIAGKETALPENPHVKFDLPVVTVTAAPFKPTVSYGSS